MAERLKVKETVGPGIWIDTNNHLHVSISDLLDHFGWPHDDEHKAEVERGVQMWIREQFPKTRFVAQGACPNCGVSDAEKHRADCELA